MKRFLPALLLLSFLLADAEATAQETKRPVLKEQSTFGYDSETPVEKPFALSGDALNALSTDERVRDCLEREGLSAGDLPTNWFVASQIRLGGTGRGGLVVLPGPGTTCLIGANTSQLWVLLKTPAGYELVLSEIGLGLTVLKTITNGLRDIEIFAAVGGYDDRIQYEFVGRRYQMAKRYTRLIGAELPKDFLKFETRGPIVQSRTETPDSVLAQARAWLWQRWRDRRPSLLKFSTFDKRGDKSSYACFISYSDGQ